MVWGEIEDSWCGSLCFDSHQLEMAHRDVKLYGLEHFGSLVSHSYSIVVTASVFVILRVSRHFKVLSVFNLFET